MVRAGCGGQSAECVMSRKMSPPAALECGTETPLGMTNELKDGSNILR